MPRRPSGPVGVPRALERVDRYYTIAFYGQQLGWMHEHAPPGVAIIVGDAGGASDPKGGDRKPLIVANISDGSRRTAMVRRSLSTFVDKLADAIAAGAEYAWVPVRLNIPGDMHANALWVDLRSSPLTFWHFEPHGGNAQDKRHDGCGFTNYHNSKQYFGAMHAYLEEAMSMAGISDWKYVAPDEFEPPVFGQSLSNVRGPGLGDPWCGFYTTWFLLEATRTGSPTALVQRFMACSKDPRLPLMVTSTMVNISDVIRRVKQAYTGDALEC